MIQETIDFLTEHEPQYREARENVRARLKEVDEDKNLFNASIEDIERNIWNQNEFRVIKRYTKNFVWMESNEASRKIFTNSTSKPNRKIFA